MKNTFLPAIFLLNITCTKLIGQESAPPDSCHDFVITKQADSLKSVYGSNGLSLIKEASIGMDSEHEMPVVMPLSKETTYLLVFIGTPGSRIQEIKLFDWNEKQVAYHRKKAGDKNSNIITFEYTALQSEFHTLRAFQVNKNKKKKLCGYVILFKKATTNP